MLKVIREKSRGMNVNSSVYITPSDRLGMHIKLMRFHSDTVENRKKRKKYKNHIASNPNSFERKIQM